MLNSYTTTKLLFNKIQPLPDLGFGYRVVVAEYR